MELQELDDQMLLIAEAFGQPFQEFIRDVRTRKETELSKALADGKVFYPYNWPSRYTR